MQNKDGLKKFLTELLFTRQLFQGPDHKKPLYSYHVEYAEYKELERLLKESCLLAFHRVYGSYWAAGFCLYVSEWFRREYDSAWTWKVVEKKLGVSFSAKEKTSLVEQGLLLYWKRPIREGEKGRKLLGSLFAEGGLPWQLVQSENHGFGRIVRKGLKHYYRTKHDLRTTIDLIRQDEYYLPQTFANQNTLQILAGIIDQLIFLAEQYPIKEVENPAAYLDKQCENWCLAFPIPLDQKNAQSMINGWLKDAGKSQQKQKAAVESDKTFSCKHQLHGDLSSWSIRTELTLPKRTSIPRPESLSSTRLELGFFEGETLIAKGGAVYAKFVGNGDKNIDIRFPETLIEINRISIDQPVVLKLIDNGRAVHAFHFDNSLIDFDSCPLTFEGTDDEWSLASQASCTSSDSLIRIRLPAGSRIVSGKTALLCRDQNEGEWFEAKDDLSVYIGADLYRISFKVGMSSAQLSLSGQLALYQARPNTVFVGFPRLIFPEDYGYPREELSHWINSTKVTSVRNYNGAGIIRYTVKHKNGETILRRKVGVLPKDFYISISPETGQQPARLRIYNGEHLLIQPVGEGITFRESKSQHSHSIRLAHSSQHPPAFFTLEVSDASGAEPIELLLPYPYQGARLIDREHNPLTSREITLEDLLGLQLILFSGQARGQIFHLHFELLSKHLSSNKRRLSRDYQIQAGSEPVPLSLFGFRNAITELLGVVNDQDAYVRLTLETSQPLLRINIRRYSRQIEWQGREQFMIAGFNDMPMRQRLSHIPDFVVPEWKKALRSIGKSSVMDSEIKGSKTSDVLQALQESIPMKAMLISDPKMQPVKIKEEQSEGSRAGVYNIPVRMTTGGLWLIYPDSASSVQFRPAFYAGDIAIDREEMLQDAQSLHHATQLFNLHPDFNSGVIDGQVNLMGDNLEHSGWQYIADVKKNFSHLSLSVFEAWQSLVRNALALAVAIFRLQLDEAFCLRIRDELAVIWESIPLATWHQAYGAFQKWVTAKGWPEVTTNNLLENSLKVLKVVVSGLEYLGDYIAYGDVNRLQVVPIVKILPAWSLDLRRNHAENEKWPTELGTELRAWIHNQNLPATIKRLSTEKYTHAVTLLPVYMGYVTAGKIPVSEICSDAAYLNHCIRTISDFDRSSWYAPVHATMVSWLLAQDV